jgi:hypothetical protein
VHGRQTRAAQSAKTRPALHHEFRPATGDGRAIIDRPDLGTIPCPSIPHTTPHGGRRQGRGDLISLSEDGGRAPTPAYRVCGCAHAAPQAYPRGRARPHRLLHDSLARPGGRGVVRVRPWNPGHLRTAKL